MREKSRFFNIRCQTASLAYGKLSCRSLGEGGLNMGGLKEWLQQVRERKDYSQKNFPGSSPEEQQMDALGNLEQQLLSKLQLGQINQETYNERLRALRDQFPSL